MQRRISWWCQPGLPVCKVQSLLLLLLCLSISLVPRQPPAHWPCSWQGEIHNAHDPGWISNFGRVVTKHEFWPYNLSQLWGSLTAASARGLLDFRGHLVLPKSGQGPMTYGAVFWSLDSIFQEACRPMGTSWLLWSFAGQVPVVWPLKSKREGI